MADDVARRAQDAAGVDTLEFNLFTPTAGAKAGKNAQAVVAVDPVTGAPDTTLAALKSQFDSTFSRILEKRFLDSEEVRYDIPATLTNASLYLGAAPDGTLTSAASWAVVRFYFGATGTPERARIRSAITWDDRTSGWT